MNRIRWMTYCAIALILAVLFLPAILLGQADTLTMPFDPTDPEAYEFGLTALVGVGLVQLLKFYFKALGKASDAVKAVVGLIVAFGISQVSRLINVPLPGNPETWTGTAYNALAEFLVMAGLHAVGKKVGAQLLRKPA